MTEWSGNGGLIYASLPSYPLGSYFHTIERIKLFRWLMILLSVLILLLGYILISTYITNADFDDVWVFIFSAGVVFFISEPVYRGAMVSAHSLELRQDGITLFAFPWNRFKGQMRFIPYQDLTKVVAYHMGTGNRWKRRPRTISAIKLHSKMNVGLNVGVRNKNDYEQILKIFGEQQGIPIVYKLAQTV